MGRSAVRAVRAPRLQPGMRIGVVSPAGPPDAADLDAGVAALRAAGYDVAVGAHAYDRYGFLAGLPAARTHDMNEMLVRSDVDAVFCSRGGTGTPHVLNGIDWAAAGAHPKVVLGYSDITVLHLAIERNLGWVTFHGPMVTAIGRGLGPRASASLWPAMTRAEAPGVLPVGDAEVGTLVPGTAEGRLGGGCLELLAHACGTHYAPDFAGRIVLLEDVGVPIYRADRAMAQLAHSGALSQAAGFVVGTLTGWRDHDGPDAVLTPHEVWQQWLVPLGKPAVVGYPFGHVDDPVALPLGCRVRLDAAAATLDVLEPAVC